MKQRINHFLKKSRYLYFAIGGTTIFLYEILLTYFLTEVGNIWYFYSYIFALTTGLFFMFIFHALITFKKHDKKFRRLVKFLIVLAFSYILNLNLVYLFTERLGFRYLISITAVTMMLSLLNYGLCKLWVFRKYSQEDYKELKKTVGLK